MKILSGKFGGVKIALLAIVGGAVVAYGGYRLLFARTGEAAVALIPSDATFVMTLDTHPSESQISAFSKLSNALKREGLDKDIEKGINDIVGKSGIASDVRKYLTHNMAMAMWTSLGPNAPTAPSSDPFNGNRGLALLSIDDPGAVGRILSSGTPVQGAGIPAFSFGKPGMVCAVIGDYLAISSDAATLGRAEDTRRGGNSIATLREYQEARSALPPDANLMFFVSPAALAQMNKGSGQAFSTNRWMSFSAALRDGGIEFSYRGPVQASNFPGLSDVAGMQPLDVGVLRKLPEGAFGLIAYSQVSKYYPLVEQTAKKIEPASWDKGVAEFERETGISVKNDLLPAFQGDTVLAVYPDSGQKDSIDGILLIDNANGGNPAGLADKVRAYVERKSAQDAQKGNGTPIHFKETHIGATTMWSLDEASAKLMRESMGGRPKPDGTKDIQPQFADKNVAYIVSNGTLVVASSRTMINRSVLALNGDRSLADDPAFADMASRLDQRAQGMWMVALSRILDHYQADIAHTLEKSKTITSEDLIGLFGGLNTGLVGSGHVEQDVALGSLYLPLDYDRMAKLIREAEQGSTKSEEPANSAALPR